MSIQEGLTSDQAHGSETKLIFEKFKDYFDKRFSAIATPNLDSTAVRELRNKLEAKDMSRPGNIAQFEFCGQLEILLDRIKVALISNGDIDSAIESVEVESLISDRKKKIRIADGSKAGWATVTHMDKKGSENLSAEQQFIMLIESLN